MAVSTRTPEPTARGAITLDGGDAVASADALREMRLRDMGQMETALSLGVSASASSSQTGMSGVNPRMRMRSTPVSGQPGLYEVTLNNTGSGWQEKFLFQTPLAANAAPAPMLVAFHKFGVSHWDIFYNTSFLAEARARGWYAIAPLGASGVNYGSLESQINTRAAIELVTSLYNIDKKRIYGVGFSMGGGCAVSFAARNLDPERVMMAAVVDHTGGVSLTHTYYCATDDNDADDNVPEFGANLEVPDVLDYWFEGAPWLYTFNYLRSSAFDLSPWTGVIDPATDMARNLGHVPTLVWLADGEPSLSLFSQSMRFYNHIQPHNQADMLNMVPANLHTWTTLDEAQACDYLAQFTLQLPTSGRTLADEDGVFFHFRVEQDQAFQFTPFTWDVDAARNRVTFSATGNLKRVSVNSESAGLDFSMPVTVNVASEDGTNDEVVLMEVPSAPSAVLRDGEATTVNYDAREKRLVLAAADTAPHYWVIQP